MSLVITYRIEAYDPILFKNVVIIARNSNKDNIIKFVKNNWPSLVVKNIREEEEQDNKEIGE